MKFPKLDDTLRLKRLQPPTGKVRMVLDTDTYNEIDDQFALVYSLLSPDNITLEAVHTAPFHNDRSSGPGDGMEKSYEEILRVFKRMNMSPDGMVFKGSTAWLPDAETPVESQAARDLIERSKNTDNGPLYISAIGAITNVASAILIDPTIIERIVVVWLGGQNHSCPSAREFNLQQDIPAAQVIFNSGVPLIQFPTTGVTEMLRTTLPEMERYVKGRGAIGDYLYEIFAGYQPKNDEDKYCWSKVIWDIIAPAWVINAAWAPTILTPSPILTTDCTWSFDARRHFIRVCTGLDRDAIFRDLFKKIETFTG